MSERQTIFVVESDPGYWPTEDHLEQGYENECDYRAALLRIYNKWRGRTGECVGTRNGFVQLRFLDTPGTKQDKAWLPTFLLSETEAGTHPSSTTGDETPMERDVNSAFGFS
jgi:hypothetical protein